MNLIQPRKFFLGFMFAFAGILGFFWLWAGFGAMWFLEGEYPMWKAKMELIAKCEPGPKVIFGDSRPFAALIPSVLGDDYLNLALGAASPIEMYYELQHLLKCPVQPTGIVLSLSHARFAGGAGHYAYWTRAALFGFLSYAEMEEVRHSYAAIHEDQPIYSASASLFRGLDDKIKNVLYAIHFPALYFGAMLDGLFFWKYKNTYARFTETLSTHGHHLFGTAESCSGLGTGAEAPEFRSLPIYDYYFNKLLALSASRGIPVRFVMMPVNKETDRMIPTSVRNGFRDYLAKYSARYSNFQTVDIPFPSLPADYFGDENHVNAKGAALWSKRLAPILKASFSN